MTRSLIIGAIAAVVAVALAATAYLLLRPAAQEASIDNALEAVSEGADQVALTDASGMWAVDTGIGEFSFADATASFVGFRIDETLASVGQTEAVGRTPAVSGTLQIDGTTLTQASITADFTAIESDVPRRDNAMRRAMGVAEHPDGTFVLTQPVDFGTIPADGETVSFSAAGELTVNGVTNPATLMMEASVADGSILVVGTTPVIFADFDIQTPSSPAVVELADDGTVEVQLWFSPA